MEGADVRSVDILREWLASLSNYKDGIQEALSGARQEARRGEEWLQEQLAFWTKAVRRTEEEVHQAKLKLLAKKTPGPTGREPDTTEEEKLLRRAQAKLEYAEEKVKNCKAWIVKLPDLIDEHFIAPAHRLQAFMDVDLAKAMAQLDNQAAALEKYLDVRQKPGR